MKKFFSQLLANTRDSKKRGFTLIELLIVIGILGIIVVAVLLTLNPAEAQRRTRDADRLKDLSELQSAIDQWVNNPNNAIAAVTLKTSAAGGTACASNWTTLDLCSYVTSVQDDPVNTTSRSVAGAVAGAACPTANTITASAVYRFQMAANGEYELNVRQESSSNCGAITGDGGDSNAWVEAGTDPGLNLIPVGSD